MRDKDRTNLTEAEQIKEWWQYTEELYKKDPNLEDTCKDTINDIGPDILESEVQWALENTQYLMTCSSRIMQYLMRQGNVVYSQGAN